MNNEGRPCQWRLEEGGGLVVCALLCACAVRVSLNAGRFTAARLARFSLALGLRIVGARVDAIEVIVDTI